MRDDMTTERTARSGPLIFIGAVLIVVICLGALCVKILWNARKTEWTRAVEVAQSLLVAVASETERNIESLDLSMRAVIDGLSNPEVRDVSPTLRQLVLFDRSATARHLDALTALDAQGIVQFDSRAEIAERINRSDREYFLFHRDDPSPDIYISRPIVARSTGNNLMAMSRRLSAPDGSFAGVVIGSLRLAYFRELFGNILRDSRDRITLRRTDGTVLMRWPGGNAVGQVREDPELVSQVARRRSGQFVSTRDGIERLVVYQQISDLPLVIDIARPIQAIYQEWRQYAIAVGSLLALLCAVSLALIVYLLKDMRRRAGVLAELTARASTDALTGVFNRLHFDETLRHEWWRAVRESSPIALLMIDADHFKRLNDQHGHQVGDRILQSVGAALKANARTGIDLPARYGGDEFTMLLPGHTAEEAQRIAIGVRDTFVQECKERSVPDVRLSIGVASATPGPDDMAGALVAAADDALYRAKELGRDRIEVADGPIDPARLLMWSARRRAA